MISSDNYFVMRILKSRVNEPREAVRFYVTPAIKRQVQTNHYQSMEYLNERGGLSWSELAAVLECRKFKQLSQDEARERVLARAKMESSDA